MAVGEGKFVLYSRIEPPLKAGDYRLTAEQKLSAQGASGALDSAALPVEDLPIHFRVRSPRFALPPDQVLSTFPPANSEGNYGMRLPQIVIKRRTLPWERRVSETNTQAPWLALVLIREGEAELQLNAPVAQCVTPGVELSGKADAELGNYLLVRRSIVDKVFPTQVDVPLLAHAREVDLNDTELMMGDDDGFLAVVIANRLPLPTRDADGNDVPVKYIACLVNLEGQFDELLPHSPPQVPTMTFPVFEAQLAVDLASWDHVKMGRATPKINPGEAFETPLRAGPGVRAPAKPAAAKANVSPLAGTPAFEANDGWSKPTMRSHADVYAEMARPFAQIDPGRFTLPEKTYRFPVLLHWSFTSVGETTFQKLMHDLDSGLLGNIDENAPVVGREPPEVVETGHVGLALRNRRGDKVRAWYRGPFVPHPTQDPPGGRLALAHAADQLRIVIPDGREDISLASAFEIGRLLALSRPSMVAALLRWRQLHYQTARRRAIWEEFAEVFDLGKLDPRLKVDWHLEFGRRLARTLAEKPEQFLGNPRPLVDPGLPLALERPAIDQLALGFALDAKILSGSPIDVAMQLQLTEIPVASIPASPKAINARTRATLTQALDASLERLVADTFVKGRVAEPMIDAKRAPRGAARVNAPPDAIDELLARMSKEEDAP
jgi:hypothetical protein